MHVRIMRSCHRYGNGILCGMRCDVQLQNFGYCSMKLVVMLITVSIHGPVTISGFNSLAACDAARPPVVGFFKRTTRSHAVESQCIELPN